MLSFNLGGPLIKFSGTVIPIPLSSLSYARGMSEITSIYGSLHTTSLLFRTVQLEVGVLRNLAPEQEKLPGVSTSLTANLALDFQGNTKLWPQLDLNLYKTYSSKKHFAYIGVSNWFELSSTRSTGEKQPYQWLFNPEIGNTFNSAKWAYTVELKYLVPNVPATPNVVSFVSPGGRGALGMYFTIARRF
jgi:hypothetical protein